MALEEVIEVAKTRIALEIAKDEKRLQSEISTIGGNLNARGLLRSGNYILEVQQACAAAASDRIQTAWEILHRAISTVGIEPDDTTETKLTSAIASHFPDHMEGLKYRVIEACKMAGQSDLHLRIPDEVGNARTAALAEVTTEIKLFLLTQKKRPEARPYSPQYNFHNSTIGSVQTGNQSVANVQVHSGIAANDLIKALEVVSQALSTIPDIAGYNKAEILELVADGKNELTKEKPNKAKLSAYLPTISSALSIVAELKPAYEGLKTAANAFGLQLP